MGPLRNFILLLNIHTRHFLTLLLFFFFFLKVIIKKQFYVFFHLY